MAGERILVIDDAEGVRKLLRTSLLREGFNARFAGSGEEGLEAIRREPPDLIVLDLMLPAMDGLEVCRRLKADRHTQSIPVIMLTGRSEETDVIRGLEMGADDYMVKPFSPKVLIARLRAVLRRHGEVQEEAPAALVLHDLTIDASAGEVLAGGQPVLLSHPEFRFLHLLASAVLAGDGAPEPDPRLFPPTEGEVPDSPGRLLEQEGMTLFALNRLVNLAPLFSRLPDPLLRQHPWLAFYAGLVRFHCRQGDALGCLEAAREGFAAVGDDCGELLALSQLLLERALLPAQDGPLSRQTERAEALAAQRLANLCSYAQIHVAQALALAAMFRCGSDQTVVRYQELALSLAEQQAMPGFGALAYFCSGYQALRRGDLPGLVRLLERCDPLLQSAQTSFCEQTLLRLLQLYALVLRGDMANGNRLLARMESEVDAQLPEGSLLRLELGMFAVVANLLDSNPDPNFRDFRHWLGEAPAPWQHRFLVLGAMAAQRRGLREEATAMLVAAQPLLAECDNRFDQAWCGLLLGSVGLLLGRGEPREALLRAREAAAELGNGWLAVAIAGVLLALELRTGTPAGADLECWLTGLGRDDGLALRCCPREIRQQLFAAVLAAGLGGQAKPLATSLDLVMSEGGALPLLEVQTLGGICIRLDGRVVLRAEDLTPAQRELLALLVAVPEMKLSQEEVQLDFWPDSPPEKARSSFDSLLLRLRKTLEAALAPASARDYLLLQKGILSLDNLRVDAHVFAGLIRLGLDLVRRNQNWQAGNAFASAHGLWKGSFMPGASARDHASNYREELDLLYVVGMHSWAELLLSRSQSAAAEEVLLQAMRIDRINDRLVKTLCRCHLRNNNPIKARQVTQTYADTLRREGYSGTEIDQILAGFPPILKGCSAPG